MSVKGVWVGDEKIINGVGRITPGTIDLPDSIASDFERQGLFIPEPKVKSTKEGKNNVRAND